MGLRVRTASGARTGGKSPGGPRKPGRAPRLGGRFRARSHNESIRLGGVETGRTDVSHQTTRVTMNPFASVALKLQLREILDSHEKAVTMNPFASVALKLVAHISGQAVIGRHNESIRLGGVETSCPLWLCHSASRVTMNPFASVALKPGATPESAAHHGHNESIRLGGVETLSCLLRLWGRGVTMNPFASVALKHHGPRAGRPADRRHNESVRLGGVETPGAGS